MRHRLTALIDHRVHGPHGRARPFPVAGRAFAPRQFRQHVGRTQSVPREQHEAMEPQVGDFGGDADFITVLRRHDRFGRLLADLLQDGVVAFREQRGDVGRRRIGALARFDRRGDAREHVVVDGRQPSP